MNEEIEEHRRLQLERRRIRARERRQAMTTEQREQQLAQHRTRARERQQAMSIEQREQQLAQRRSRARERREAMSLEQREQQLAQHRTRATERRQAMSLEQREQQLAQHRTRARERRQAMSLEQREQQLAQHRTRARERRQAMSIEQREQQLAQRRSRDRERRVVVRTNLPVEPEATMNEQRQRTRQLQFQRRQTRGQRRTHNNARNFMETAVSILHRLRDPRFCLHCRAKLFESETQHLCCSNGSITLPSIRSPQEIQDLYNDQTEEGKHFRRYIRSYNHIFSFTSMGVHIDQDLTNARSGVYTFRAQGSIYHRIGSLLPRPGNRPRFLQLYIYDTDHEIDNRLAENDELDRRIILKLQQILDANNQFVHHFRQLSQSTNIHTCKLIIKEQPPNQRQYALPTASQVAAIVVGDDEASYRNGRDIIVQTSTGHLMYVSEVAGYYDPLQYPLLLPYGSYGWDINSRTDSGERVTCREFYSYILQVREGDTSLFLRAGRLLQQYAVDNYVKIESGRMRWIRENQDDIRSELYVGLQDALNAGENNAANIGRRTILPSSFNGGPRYMYQRYQDAMALVQKYGKPDFFITMTCNTSWPEITSELLPGQRAEDRSELTTRIFRAKFESMRDDIYYKHVLGHVVAYVSVIEFQKRGLPHAHMLIILSDEDRLHSPDQYDGVVRAEIPDRDLEPRLYNSVIRSMIHGPCGLQRPNCSCMKHGSCKRGFPKQFSPVTVQGNDSYPIYRRRNNGISVALDPEGNNMVDNRWVVPYNPWLLLKYDCHLNVEVCSTIAAVKYLYKYVYKGPDRVTFEVRPGSEHDEVQKFVDARWICAPESFWRIFEFPLNAMQPAVLRLQIHLPSRQQVRYRSDQSVSDILLDRRLSTSMLIEFFNTNANDTQARQYLYREFPEHYRWDTRLKKWFRRNPRSKKVIGRIYNVCPTDGERFFLRLILNHVRGPTSFDDILTIDGIIYPTFQQAAERMGLLEEDRSIWSCLTEATVIRMPSALRRLFVTILVFCQPTRIRPLWDEFWVHMAEDYPSSSTMTETVLQNRLLCDLNELFVQHGKNISDYDLPRIRNNVSAHLGKSRLIDEQLLIPITQEDLMCVSTLNNDQLCAFQSIIDTIMCGQSKIFFIDGPGGTGKTYLYRAILASIRQEGKIAIATATSGIAANNLPGGRTAHSRFKIPLSPTTTSVCMISKQSDITALIRESTVIIWDEATMTHRHAFEAFDRTLRDILSNNLPFGGKVLILGGDFRQVLPVVPHGTKTETIDACIVRSPLWQAVNVIHLKQNMRAREDPFYSEYLLRVGDGIEPTINDDMIRIPQEILIPWENEHSITSLINVIFPNLADNAHKRDYMVNRALITSLNDDVDQLNEKVIGMFPGDEVTYFSFDSVEDDPRNLYLPEFLNSISPGGLPPHKLTLKIGAPIMVLRNLDPKVGVCNGTRLLCRGFQRNLIDAEIIAGQSAGTRVLIPRIPLKPPEDLNLPFVLIRKQFPIRLSFALTINKSQGQTIPNVGIYLPQPVFSHGQLYVALSRGVSMRNTKVLIKNGEIHGQPGTYTKNVVYKEVLTSSR